MSKTITPTPATATVIREVYKARGFKVPEVALASLLGKDGKGTKVRGRIHPAAQRALIEAFPGEFVAVDLGNGNATPKAEKVIEVPRVKTDAAGRKRTLKPVTMTLSEVRALAGTTGKKGRVSKAEVEAAGAAAVAAMPAPRARKAAAAAE